MNRSLNLWCQTLHMLPHKSWTGKLAAGTLSIEKHPYLSRFLQETDEKGLIKGLFTKWGQHRREATKGGALPWETDNHTRHPHPRDEDGERHSQWAGPWQWGWLRAGSSLHLPLMLGRPSMPLRGESRLEQESGWAWGGIKWGEVDLEELRQLQHSAHYPSCQWKPGTLKRWPASVKNQRSHISWLKAWASSWQSGLNAGSFTY